MSKTLTIAYYCSDGATFATKWDKTLEFFPGSDNDENKVVDILRTEEDEDKFALFGKVVFRINSERDCRNLPMIEYGIVLRHWVQLSEQMCDREWVQMMGILYDVDMKEIYKRR